MIKESLNLGKILMGRKKIRVCYFGTYIPDYPCNKVLINGLKKNGVEVVE